MIWGRHTVHGSHPRANPMRVTRRRNLLNFDFLKLIDNRHLFWRATRKLLDFHFLKLLCGTSTRLGRRWALVIQRLSSAGLLFNHNKGLPRTAKRTVMSLPLQSLFCFRQKSGLRFNSWHRNHLRDERPNTMVQGSSKEERKYSRDFLSQG